jgi:hypothetical protein
MRLGQVVYQSVVIVRVIGESIDEQTLRFCDGEANYNVVRARSCMTSRESKKKHHQQRAFDDTAHIIPKHLDIVHSIWT